MYAVIKSGGKQYCVKQGDIIEVEKLSVDPDQNHVQFDNVLAINDGQMVVGTPIVEGAVVDAKIIEQGKGPKVITFKYKAKKDYRKKQGHRQPFTKVEITNITYGKTE